MPSTAARPASVSARAASAAVGPARAMVPREHGAWFQLAVPALGGLALGEPGAAALLLLAGAFAAFLAHEPARLLLWSRRTGRASPAVRSAASRWLAGWGALGLMAGSAGLALAPGEARWAALVPAALAVPLAALLAKGRERTTAGETLAAWTLASVSLPVALAAGAEPRAALASAGVWMAVYLVATLGVRSVIARAKGRGGRWLAAGALAFAAAAVASAGLVAAVAGMSAAMAIALLPVSLFAAALALAPPHPRRLRQIGWGLAAASVVTLLILVGGLR